MEEKPIYQFGDFHLDVAEKQLRRACGEILAIPPKAFELLVFLVENPRHLLEKNELMDKVWADSFVEEGNLKLQIHTLRKTLNENGVEYIQTIPRRGYRFNADVTAASGELVVERFTHSKLTVESREMDDRLTSSKPRVKTAWMAALVVGIITVAGAVYFGMVRPRTSSPIAAAPQTPITLAVLPLKNLTQDQRDDFLSVGLADALIARLSGIQPLVVRPTSAVLPFATAADPSQNAGQLLKVESVLGGTIQRVDDRIRVSVQLTNTADNRVIWAGNFEAPDSDLFKFQDAFSSEIAAALQLNISSRNIAEFEHRKTANSEAYRLYLTARYNFAQQRGDNVAKAVEQFREASQLDPQFALAHAGVGESYMVLGESGFGAIKPEEAYQNAIHAMQRALEIDPNLPQAYAVMGNIQAKFTWDLTASEASYRRAIELDPNYARAHHLLGWLLIRQSRFEEADAEFHRAAELNPTSLETASESGYPAFFAGDYNRSIYIFRAAVERDKSYLPGHTHLWRAYYHAGRVEEAAAEAEAIGQLIGPGIPVIEMIKGRTFSAQGKIKEAREVLASLIERKQKGDAYTSPLFIAILAADLDDANLTFKYLDDCLAERNEYMPFLKIGPEFTKYRSDARFTALTQKIGL